MKSALTIAGSDCSGGAGIQADLKTFAAHGLYGMSAIVSVVAENTSRVIEAEDVSPSLIAHQIEAVFEDLEVDGVKIGMLPSVATMEVVASQLKKWKPKHVVIDPVMIAKNGFPLMDSHLGKQLIKLILPLADVLTPNLSEAEVLTGMNITTLADMEESARAIHQFGPKYVLVKGGHLSGDAVDLLFDGSQVTYFREKRIDTKNTHGTGCTYSSAITANLALGLSLQEAVKKGKEYVTMAIAHSLAIGKGCGPTHHFYDLYQHGLPNKEKHNG